MTLFVDRLEKYNLGGSTSSFEKVEYILAVHGLNFEKILSKTPKETKIPSGAFDSGKYVVMYNISWDLKSVNLSFINYQTDLDGNFDAFADSFSPKAVSGFHQLKEKIKLKDQSELTRIELSDNDSDFVIAYQNYIDHRNRQ